MNEATLQLENILQLGDETPVVDRDTSLEIPFNIRKREFTLVCPYRIRDDNTAFLEKPEGLRSFFHSGCSTRSQMTKDLAAKYARGYLHYQNRRWIVVVTGIREATLEEPTQIGGREKLNFFEIKGTVYYKTNS